MSGQDGAVHRRQHPYRLYGVAFIAAIAAFVAVCVLAFDRVFQPAAYVTVDISRAGLQLLPGSDVKLRGIELGTVDSITSNGNHAVLRLRLTPSLLHLVPSNVTAELVPKTLFGEKYVALQLPVHPTAVRLHNGSVIAEDRTRPVLEIDRALNDLLPVLRAVRPQDLDNTLTAIATALQGRGNELGNTIRQVGSYLHGFNPQLPRLRHDLSALATTTRTYSAAAPDLLQLLSNISLTSLTVVHQQQALANLIGNVTDAAQVTRQFLSTNAHNLVAVDNVNARVIRLLARYSPELPCFIKGDANLVPRIHDAVPKTPGLNHAAHVVVEFVPAFPTYQYPKDLPQFGDTRGPSCYGLPHPKLSLPVVHYKDGTQDDPRFAKQGQPGPVGSGRTASKSASKPASKSSGKSSTKATTAASVSHGKPTDALGALLGAVLGRPAADVPDIDRLLWGPLVRGAAVRLS